MNNQDPQEINSFKRSFKKNIKNYFVERNKYNDMRTIVNLNEPNLALQEGSMVTKIINRKYKSAFGTPIKQEPIIELNSEVNKLLNQHCNEDDDDVQDQEVQNNSSVIKDSEDLNKSTKENLKNLK